MKTIIEDICDMLSTLLYDEEEIQIYEERTNNLFTFSILIDLIKSKLMFKILCVKTTSSEEEYNAKSSNQLYNDLKQVANNPQLLEEWKEFSEFHLRYISENYPLNPSVEKYIMFELKHYNQELTDKETWEREDNQEVVYDFVWHILQNRDNINDEEWFSLRCLMESLVILNPPLLEEELFTDLISNNMKELTEEISSENFE